MIQLRIYTQPKLTNIRANSVYIRAYICIYNLLPDERTPGWVKGVLISSTFPSVVMEPFHFITPSLGHFLEPAGELPYEKVRDA